MSSLLDQTSLLHLIGVAVGAGLGSVCRSAVDRSITRRVGATRLPWATLMVNVVGSLILGFVLGLSAAVAASAGVTDEQVESARTIELVIGIGFAGGLTTFSTFSWESWSLIHEGRGRGMLVYAALTIALGLAAVALGTALGRAIG